MFKYVIIPLATRLVPKYEAVLKELESQFEVHRPVTSLQDLEHEKLENVNLIVFLFLTGGTSRIAVQLDLIYKVPKVIIAHPEDNSLPSALGYLERKHTNTRDLLILEKLENITNRLRSVLCATSAAHRASNSRIIVIGENSIRNEWLEFLKKTNIRLIFLKDRIRKDSNYDVFIENMYKDLKELVMAYNADGITLDCFKLLKEVGYTPCLAFAKLLADGIPVACECDIISLFCMILLKNISEELLKKSMMANLCNFNGNSMLLAHCTLSLGMCEKYELVPHFETGLRYGVKGSIATSQICTVFRVSSDFSKMFIRKGRIVRSSYDIEGNLCVSRLVIEFEKSIEASELLGNHHIITLGDIEEMLKVCAWYLGLRIV